MGYEYIRKLIAVGTEAEAKSIIERMEQEGIEVYSKTEKAADFRFTDSGKGCLDNEIYITAADRGRAVEIVTELGLGEQVCEDKQIPETLSELEKAEEQFMRKRKRTYIEGIVICVIVFIYMIVRMYMG